MSPHDRENLANAWLTYQRHWWAYEALLNLRRDSPKEAFAVVARLIELADDDEMLGDIGAGPLEDLIREHGSLLIADIEARAASEFRFRQALSHVWLSESESELGQRFLALGCQQVGAPT